MAKRVLILGGGFAGLAAARVLGGRADVQATLIDRQDHSCYAPMLPDLISARVQPDRLGVPLAKMCRRFGVTFRQASVYGIDPHAPAAETSLGRLDADFLIDALGCVTNTFGQDETVARAIELKEIRDGMAMHRRALALLGRARRFGTPARCLVVGGGYTGVETASHLANLLWKRSGLDLHRLGDLVRVDLFDVADDILMNVSERVRRFGRRLLARCGVRVRTGMTVEHIDEEGTATLSDGQRVHGPLVAWTPGVSPGACSAGMDLPTRKGKRLAVDEHLRLPGCERAFAAGDVAGPVRPGAPDDAPPLRMSIQFSLTGGKRAGLNVLAAAAGRPLRVYDPFDPGYVVPLGPGVGAGKVMGVPLVGTAPVALHYFMCAARSWTWRQRAGTLADVVGGLGW